MGQRATRDAGRWRPVAALAGLAVAVHLWGLYRVSGPPTPWFPDVDKIEHAVGFALPAALVTLAFGLRRLERGLAPSRRTLGLVVAVLAVHAVVSELVQHFLYRQRTGDPRDVLADLVGLGLGALVAVVVLRRAQQRAAAEAVPERVSSRDGAP